MNFKVGQKVRVKEWVDMPEEMFDSMGINGHAGKVGVVVVDGKIHGGYKAYDVRTKGGDYDFFCFEDELEPLIKVGQQLLFSFME